MKNSNLENYTRIWPLHLETVGFTIQKLSWVWLLQKNVCRINIRKFLVTLIQDGVATKYYIATTQIGETTYHHFSTIDFIFHSRFLGQFGGWTISVNWLQHLVVSSSPHYSLTSFTISIPVVEFGDTNSVSKNSLKSFKMERWRAYLQNLCQFLRRPQKFEGISQFTLLKVR